MAAPRLHAECSIDQCTDKHLALGLCRRHWKQQRWAEGKDRSASRRKTARTHVELRAHVNGERRTVIAEILRAEGERARAWIHCPDCERYTAADSELERRCRNCGTSVTLVRSDYEAAVR